MITLVELNDYDENANDLAIRICRSAIENMQSKNGYFFYRQGRFFKNRIAYMRWSQAWMLYALAILLEKINGKK